MKECDLVMKGGITSGVVYPKAIIGLSREYRFRQVGGASAGAIAAVIAAAAEYNRDGGGFDRLDELPADVANGLERFFQPASEYKKVFKRVLSLIQSKRSPGFWFLLRNAVGIIRSIKRLPKTNFGVCPGTSTDSGQSDALMEWLNRRIEYTAGRMSRMDSALPETPLTFGMLKDKGVMLRLVTTNLSQRRPESLPIRRGFDVMSEDLEWIMPANVRDWIRSRDSGKKTGLVDVPSGDDMPVLFAVRLSLSYPVLFKTVPLYRPDWSLAAADEDTRAEPVRNLFCDGGLSSNMPIHYFDAALPKRPTFGINLTAYHEGRNGPDDGQRGWNRIYMPAKAGAGLTYGVETINGLFGFVMSLLNSAKDWQDSMQLRMPGYRERVVHIALKENEGGINLNMSKDTIDRLLRLGDLASRRILKGHNSQSDQFAFEFDIHRWRRVLATSVALEEAVGRLVDAYLEEHPSGDLNALSVQEMLDGMATDFPSEDQWAKLGYKPPGGSSDIASLKARFDGLIALKNVLEQNPRSPDWNMPSPRAAVRFRSDEI